MKNKVKTYYIGLNKADNSIILASSKVEIAKFMKISVDTLNRRIGNSSGYNDNEWGIWCDVKCKTIKRGYKLKSAKAYQH